MRGQKKKRRGRKGEKEKKEKLRIKNLKENLKSKKNNNKENIYLGICLEPFLATPRSLSPLERNIGFWTQA